MKLIMTGKPAGAVLAMLAGVAVAYFRFPAALAHDLGHPHRLNTMSRLPFMVCLQG